jgi:transcriptional regulator with XRE-family HTH domain
MHRNLSMAKASREKQVQTRFKEAPFKPTFVRQWRKHRRLTLEVLADRVGMSAGNLSNIERGVTGYGQETLEALADALQCGPADLLMRNPSDPAMIWSLWEQARPAERKQIIGMIEGYLKSGRG